MASQPTRNCTGGGPPPPKVRLRPAKLATRQLEDHEAALNQIKTAITEIYHYRQSTLKFEECYRNAYNLVRANLGVKLHATALATMGENLNRLYRLHLRPFHHQNFNNSSSPSPTDPSKGGGTGSRSCDAVPVENSAPEASRVEAVILIWDRHLVSLPKITSMLCYLDNYFKQHPNEACRPLVRGGPLQFYDKVLLSDGAWAKSRVTQAVLGQVALERLGGLGNRGVVKAVTSMLLLLEDGAYQTLLEGPYLAASKEFYEGEFSRLVGVASSREVLAKVGAHLRGLFCAFLHSAIGYPLCFKVAVIDQRLTEERERCTNHLSSATLPKALHVINQNVVVRFAKSITEVGFDTFSAEAGRAEVGFEPRPSEPISTWDPETGLVSMLSNDDMPGINLMYRIFKGADSAETLAPMRETLKTFYYEQGRALVPTAASSKGGRSGPAISWVKSALELKRRWDQVYAEGVNGDRTFQAAVTEGFANFINGFQHAAEFLSLFLDDQMRAIGAGKAESSDQVQGAVIALFRFLRDKDMFEGFYRTHLAKRILMGSRNDLPAEDAERALLQKLRLECGVQFTAKLEGMFKDLATASDVAQAFRQSQGAPSRDLPFDLNVTVLTSSVWPLRAPPPCILPPDALKAVAVYSDFYKLRHSGRKLTWILKLGTCDIRAQFGDRRFELITNTYHMIILLLFNTNDALSYGEIRGQTGLQDFELRRHLSSLSAGRHTLLLKGSDGADTFRLNLEFRAPTIRVKLPTPFTRLDAEAVNRVETQDLGMTRAEVEAARGHLIEAAIVRVMKTRRRLPHARLVAEVTSHLQSRFQADPAMIKRKIEALIDREFLERIEGDM
ncbi:hypothetical protein L0F63_006951 [Massospora cicadina]|nr:hypothetical protein L0F63_006951 [Massospora cicadina]